MSLIHFVVFTYPLKDGEEFCEDEEEVEGEPGDGKADADPGQDHHHLPVPLHLTLLPASVACESGILSANNNDISV